MSYSNSAVLDPPQEKTEIIEAREENTLLTEWQLAKIGFDRTSDIRGGGGDLCIQSQ